ncbi:MAG: asparagine synthase (glutamine-hydrolyzing) [Mariprofundales bacterium]
MCGIAGIIGSHDVSSIRQRIGRMNDAQRHRGPDGDGCFVKDGVALGHVRLSIVDLSDAGKQPMCNEDGSVWVSINGEIYNFQALRADLKQRGHAFRGSSDSEVIVHLYEEYGEDFPTYLDGMFAIALWDGTTRKTMLVRDRFGMKPLYYTCQNESLIFASELTALMASGLVDSSYDAMAAYGYMALGYVPTPHTIYQQVQKMRPAETVVFQDGTLRSSFYWQPERIDVPQHYDDAVAQLEVLLERSVRQHLVADVPVASFLSGGVDSSLIAALACRQQPLSTVCAAFPNSGVDESEIAAEAARYLATDHHTVALDMEHASLYRQVLPFLDEPFADSSALSTYAVCGAGRNIAKVMLSGDGGDEVFGGYTGRYRVSALKAAIPLPGVVAAMLRQLPPWRSGRCRSLPEMLDMAALDEVDRYLREREITDVAQRKQMFGAPMVHNGEAWLRYIAEETLTRCQRSHPVHRALWMDLSTSLSDDMLTKVDRMSMAHGLEVRIPLLDHHLVEFALSLPATWLVSPRAIEGKRVLRDVTAPLLPAGLLNRPKQGFVVPLNRWLDHGLKRVWQEVDLTVFDGVMQTASMQESWNGVYQYDRQDLYAMLTLGVWMQQRGGAS